MSLTDSTAHTSADEIFGKDRCRFRPSVRPFSDKACRSRYIVPARWHAEGTAMEKNARSTNGKGAFDPKAFLATVNHGRTVSDYRKGDVVFLQSSPADAVFYIQKGKIKIVVASSQGREA